MNFYFFEEREKAVYVELDNPDMFIAFLYAVRQTKNLSILKDGNYTIGGRFCTLIDIKRISRSNLLDVVLSY